jgi:hypothetical protein
LLLALISVESRRARPVAEWVNYATNARRTTRASLRVEKKSAAPSFFNSRYVATARRYVPTAQRYVATSDLQASNNFVASIQRARLASDTAKARRKTFCLIRDTNPHNFLRRRLRGVVDAIAANAQ